MSSSDSITNMGQNESHTQATELEEQHLSVEEAAGSVKHEDKPGHPKCQEWNFVDFRKAERCPIFDVDPVMLKRFVGHNVTVYNSSMEKFHGCCLAIDPVSLSVILASRPPEGGIRITTLPGYNLTKIFVDPDSISPDALVTVNDSDIAELYHAPSLLSDGTKMPSQVSTDTLSNSKKSDESEPDHPSSPPSSPINIEERKNKLKELLLKYKLPFTESGDVVELPGGIKIKPPYDIDSCDTKGNKITRKKLGELMKMI